jgi:hypothetical protein
MRASGQTSAITIEAGFAAPALESNYRLATPESHGVGVEAVGFSLEFNSSFRQKETSL